MVTFFNLSIPLTAKVLIKGVNDYKAVHEIPQLYGDVQTNVRQQTVPCFTLAHYTSRELVSLRCIILPAATKFLKQHFYSFYKTNCYLLWLLNALSIYGGFLI